jgi:hypothetical protein
MTTNKTETFIYNTIQTIQYFIDTNEKEKIVAKEHTLDIDISKLNMVNTFFGKLETIGKFLEPTDHVRKYMNDPFVETNLLLDVKYGLYCKDAEREPINVGTNYSETFLSSIDNNFGFKLKKILWTVGEVFDDYNKVKDLNFNTDTIFKDENNIFFKFCKNVSILIINCCIKAAAEDMTDYESNDDMRYLLADWIKSYLKD